MIKILHVEDDPIYRTVLKNALLKQFVDLEVYDAEDEGSALDVISANVPNLIIMDIDLKKDTNGLELTRKIKHRHSEIEIIILSQYDIPEYRHVAEQNGASHFFPKSTSLISIFDYVDSVVKKQQDVCACQV